MGHITLLITRVTTRMAMARREEEKSVERKRVFVKQEAAFTATGVLLGWLTVFCGC